MKAVPVAIAEVKRTREIFLHHHGVPISQEFADFANAIGDLCDAAAAAVDVPVEPQGKQDADYGRSRSMDKRLEAQGKPRPVTDELKREMVDVVKVKLHNYASLDQTRTTCITCDKVAEEIVTHILNRVSSTGKPIPSAESRGDGF